MQQMPNLRPLLSSEGTILWMYTAMPGERGNEPGFWKDDRILLGDMIIFRSTDVEVVSEAGPIRSASRMYTVIEINPVVVAE